MAVRKRRVKGAAAISKMLKQLPEAVRGELVVELHVTGREMVPLMQGRAPHRTGATRRGISYRVLPQSLKLQVGLIGTKAGRSRLFYARIQDLGRKAQTVTVRRFRAGGQRLYFRRQKFGPDLQTYSMNVPSMPGKRFVTGRMTDLRRQLRSNLKNIWAKALGRFAGGSSE